ncbi:EF-P 5-aminopentanol modification-associated protein YfmF [Halanaerobium hydrogeniformans]|uniref:Peptidase M16 domain protein n=1 Tax=Halanaerobium hydrogeniformans TaxID=656519 RepID=E4RLP3_HALHG|nr:pitrilysin family protein [Halanaerobium hydrogeniformans]ADQ14957.1 peptidase M16 domain protein [Halanaerobium hydrogeniformans]
MTDLKFNSKKEIPNLHYLNTDKFKTNLIQINYLLPLENSKEAAMNALFPAILRRGTNNYPSQRELRTELEDLFGSKLSFNILKRGENQIIRFSLEMVNEKFLTQKSSFSQQALKLLKEILFNPLIEGNRFKARYFAQEKENLKNNIEALINDKRSYALEQCIKKMCKNEKYGIYKLGDLDSITEIENRELFEHYQSLKAAAQKSIFLVGDFKESFIENIFANNSLLAGEDIHDQTTELLYPQKDIDFYQEELDINQAKLTIACRTGINRAMEEYYPLLIFNSLLGGSTHSKLFQEIREKRSLAYYVNSSVESTKGLLFINSGINAENQQQVIKLVKEQIKVLAEGEFSNAELLRSKKSIVNSLRQNLDSNYGLAAHYLLSLLNQKPESITETISAVKNVKREEIIEVAGRIKMDSVYLLKSEV